MRKHVASKIFALCGVAVMLTGCADEPPPRATAMQVLPPKIMLNVQSVSLTDRSGMQPADSPYATDHFSPTIAGAVKQWASDRLQAAGGAGDAIVIIKDATLTSAPLSVQQNVDSWFTRQQASKYVAHVDVTIEANNGHSYAMADADASRTVTLPENPTADEKRNAYFTLLNGLMKDLGQNLEASIREHMGAFLVSAPEFGGNFDTAPLQGTGAAVSTLSPRSAQSDSLSGVARETMPAPQSPVYGTTAFSAAPDTTASPATAPAPPAPRYATVPQPHYENGTASIPLSGDGMQ